MTVIKWAWIHGSLDAEQYPTMQEAFVSAWNAQEWGTEYLECFELPNGRIISAEDEEWLSYVRGRADEQWERLKAAPKPVARVEVRSPNGDWGLYDSADSWEKAEEIAGEWRYRLGDDRVRVVKQK